MAAARESPKGILKKQADRPKRGAGIAWDEPTIAEHDKERGTRMKIDEPDTPFERGAADGAVDEALALDGAAGPPESTGAQWDAVDALSERAQGRETTVASSGDDGEWDDSDEEDGAARPGPAAKRSAEEAARFQAARRAHYAEEVAKMKELMRRSQAGEDEDED